MAIKRHNLMTMVFILKGMALAVAITARMALANMTKITTIVTKVLAIVVVVMIAVLMVAMSTLTDTRKIITIMNVLIFVQMTCSTVKTQFVIMLVVASEMVIAAIVQIIMIANIMYT